MNNGSVVAGSGRPPQIGAGRAGSPQLRAVAKKPTLIRTRFGRPRSSMGTTLSALVLVLALVLLLVAALIVSSTRACKWRPPAPQRRAATLGGAAATLGGAAATLGVADGAVADGDGAHNSLIVLSKGGLPQGGLDESIERYAQGRALRSANPLKQYMDVVALARSPRRGGGARPPPRRWETYDSWDSLKADKYAFLGYYRDRERVLKNPNLDWGAVLARVRPLLAESREHIGIVNLEADGVTLRLEASEASPLEAGKLPANEYHETVFAGVPGELVEKYAGRPGLILFHTHPADPQGSPLPSPQDLVASIYMGAGVEFAANAVISRYGVLVYGPDTAALEAMAKAKDQRLALLNYLQDIIGAYTALRSWSEFTLDEFFSFFARHRMFMFLFPSPELVGAKRRDRFIGNLEAPVNTQLIMEHVQMVLDHKAQTQPAPKK
jgi:hypothetical protein